MVCKYKYNNNWYSKEELLNILAKGEYLKLTANNTLKNLPDISNLIPDSFISYDIDGNVLSPSGKISKLYKDIEKLVEEQSDKITYNNNKIILNGNNIGVIKLNKSDKKTAYAIPGTFKSEDDYEVGSAKFWEIQYIELKPEYRGKNIALNIYKQIIKDANKEGAILKSDNQLSQGSLTIWSKLVEDGYAIEREDGFGFYSNTTINTKQQALQLYKQTRSKEFKEWFGNSKIVDENGEPLIVYHTTKNKFDTFDKSFKQSNTSNFDSSLGFFFSEYKDYDARIGYKGNYIGKFGSVQLPVFLNVQNPHKKVDIPESLMYEEKEDLEKYTTESDGFITKDKKNKLFTIVVFEPNQIKSVFNQGTFSKKDENIYKQSEVNESEIDNVLEEFAKNLSKRFNISVEVINEQETKNRFNSYSGEPAFYDSKNNKAYLIKGKANKTSAIHEIFTHPFLLQIEKTNPKLYANLLKEAKSNKDVVEYVDNNYDTNKDHEYIARAIDLYTQNELNKQKDKNLIDYIRDFFNELSEYLKKLFNIPEVFSNSISPNITLRQLTQFAMYGKGKINLNISQEEINYTLKTVNILTNLTDKQKQEFNKLNKGSITIEQLVNNIQIPKEQKQLVIDSYNEGNKTPEQLAIDIVSKYNYSVEVRTALKEELSNYEDEEEYGAMLGMNYNDLDSVEEPIKTGNKVPTQHYSTLTVPGGTNYTENRIITPQIVPSIKGHAQFAEKEDIGWFRSDEIAGEIDESTVEYEESPFGEEIPVSYTNKLGTKTRRILELQSDLFQKGRDKDNLITKTSGLFPKSLFTIVNKEEYNTAERLGKSPEAEPIGTNEFGYGFNYIYDGKLYTEIDDEQYGYIDLKNIPDNDSKQNQFLQLLNKDNNWVTFFIKSIIQDSAKKGYEKVLFPKGETAAKIEGHETIAEIIDTVEEGINNPDKYAWKSIDNGEILGYSTRNSSNQFHNDRIIESSSKEDFVKKLKDYKQELKSQGIEKLKPIEAFYEIKVGNILEKQFGKENVKTITDEYGNQWREIDLSNEKVQQETSNIYFQKQTILTSEQQSLLDDKKELIEDSTDIRSKWHIDTQPNRDMLSNKISNINKKTYRTVAYLVEHYGEGGLKSKERYVSIGFKQLTPKQVWLRKYNLLNIKLGEGITLGIYNDKNKVIYQKYMDDINKKEKDVIYYLDRVGTIMVANVKWNYKKLDDIAKVLLSDFYTPVENIKVSDNLKDSKEWLYMINKFGLDKSIEIAKLNMNRILSINETDILLNKLNNPNDITPNEDWDIRYDIKTQPDDIIKSPSEDYWDDDIDYSAIDFDGTESFTEETGKDYVGEMFEDKKETNVKKNKEILNVVNELVKNISSEEINISEIESIEDKNKGKINKLFYDFTTKMKERINLLQEEIERSENFASKNKLRIEKENLEESISDKEEERQNLWTIIGRIEKDIKDINDSIVNNTITTSKVNIYTKILNLYKMMIYDWQNNSDNTFSNYLKSNIPFQKALITYDGIINNIMGKLAEKRKYLLKNEMNSGKLLSKSITIDEMEKIEDVDLLTSEFRDLSMVSSRLGQAIDRMLKNAEGKMASSFNMFDEELQKIIDETELDFTKKDINKLFLNDEDGSFIREYDNQFYNIINVLETLHRRLNQTTDINLRKDLNGEIKRLEKKIMYIDINEFIQDNDKDVKVINYNKLQKYEKELYNIIDGTEEYKKTKSKEIVDDIVKKYDDFLQKAESVRIWAEDRFDTHRDYEEERGKKEGETDEEYQIRRQIVINTMYDGWYFKNNPFDYIKKMKDNRTISHGEGYKYLVAIPLNLELNKNFEKIRNNDKLYKFYSFYKSNMNRLVSYLPEYMIENIGDNFLPYIEQTFMEEILKKKDFLSTIKEKMIVESTISKGATIKRLDPLGQEIFKIPIRYTKNSPQYIQSIIQRLEVISSTTTNELKEEIDKKIDELKEYKSKQIENRSNDLIMLIKSFSVMAEGYKAYSSIENEVLAARDTIANIIKIKQSEGKVQQNYTDSSDYKIITKGASNLLKMIDYTIKAQMYGQRKKHNDLTTMFPNKEDRKKYVELKRKKKELLSERISGKITEWNYITNIKEIDKEIDQLKSGRSLTDVKVVDVLTQLSGLVNLSYNVKAAINNYVFGRISIFTYAVGEQEFTLKDLRQANKLMNKALTNGLIGNNPDSRKIKSLSRLYNVVFEVNEAAYGVKTALEKKTEKLDILKPYGMTRKGEWMLQNTALIAFLLNKKITIKTEKGEVKELSLYDCYTSDGKFRKDIQYYNEGTKVYENEPSQYNPNISPLESNEFTKTKDKITKLNKIIHGNYDPNSPIIFKSRSWGKLLSQYKTWMFEGIAQKFEKEVYDDVLGRNRKGRYRSMYDIGLWRGFGLLLKSFLNKNNLSSIKMNDTDLANMKRNLIEFRFIVFFTIANIATYLLVKGLAGEDDDEEYKLALSFLNQLTRVQGDLTFYLTPNGLLNVINNPAPTASYVADWISFIWKSKRLLPSPIGSDDYTFEEWAKNGSKLLPITSEINRWIRESEKYNKEK